MLKNKDGNKMTNDNNGNGNVMDELNKIMNGISTVRSMESSNGNDVSNQFTISGDGWELFQSYRSRIALIWRGQVYLFKDWDYSRTTGKYRNQFLGEGKAETLAKLKSGEYIAADFEVEA